MRCRQEDHLCPFEVYANIHNYRDQKRTMPVGDMNLYLILNQKFSILCTWHFFFLMKLWLSTGVGGMNKTFLFFHCLILLWGELWYGKKKKKKWGEESFWSHLEAIILLQITYIPLVLKCFNLKSAQFYYTSCFIHCIRIMCWLVNIYFYIY